MNEPAASGDNLLVIRDQLVCMRAELVSGLARDELGTRRCR